MTEKSGGGTGLPASIEAAWGLRERPSKGPKPGLSLSRIVDAAVGVAAAEGLGAVSMGRVAKELGVSTMSLYRYVAAKDELYILMQEVAIGAPPPAPPPGTGWREALAQWARGQREMFHRNLWGLRIPISGPPATPNMVAWWERGLTALDGTGLDDGTKLSVILLVSGFVRTEATLMADLDAAVEASGASAEEVMAGYARTLRRLADPDRYPAVAGLLAGGVMDEVDAPDAEFTFGLERLLDGVEVLVAGRSGDAPATARTRAWRAGPVESLPGAPDGAG
ncbi:TetR/AcrR family transcriptional regulator C-terminal domain-containing protein [Streptomyces sp. NPDC002018]|uniref:TetR/AcrR family transcriptional regulator C-terminal domain-containing protein n=1 Tax=Streptomyces sp. NPDC002018 TaxID=3364629 RepID=UPI0036C52A0E